MPNKEVAQQPASPTPSPSPTPPARRHVLRRVHRSYLQPGLAIPIQPAAFRPTDRDLTGISVYFDDEVRAEQIFDALPSEKRHLYVVARIPVDELNGLGLSVVLEEADLPGHAVIPELRSELYQKKEHKQRLKDIQIELARIASREVIHPSAQ